MTFVWRSRHRLQHVHGALCAGKKKRQDCSGRFISKGISVVGANGVEPLTYAL